LTEKKKKRDPIPRSRTKSKKKRGKKGERALSAEFSRRRGKRETLLSGGERKKTPFLRG